MKLTQATAADIPAVCAFYQRVIASMIAGGLTMWKWGEYPSEAVLTEDIRQGWLYMVQEEGHILACVAVNQIAEDDYANLPWQEEGKVGLFHRLAVAPESQGKHLAEGVMEGVKDVLRAQGCTVLRGDVYGGNPKALRLYQRIGMNFICTFRQDWGWAHAFHAMEKRI
ncbi:MAG: GNAT family N-acetyltransferase [Aristaeellaceae bacterium]